MWRAMTERDLPRVGEVAALVHPTYPEHAAVFAERLALYPAGCRVLVLRGALAGYVISHPWRDGEPPALNTRLGALPARASTYYIHDIALLPDARGSKAATEIVAELTEHARRSGLPAVSLVAVKDSQPFWQHIGFQRVDNASLDAKLQSYDDSARPMERRL